MADTTDFESLNLGQAADVLERFCRKLGPAVQVAAKVPKVPLSPVGLTIDTGLRGFAAKLMDVG